VQSSTEEERPAVAGEAFSESLMRRLEVTVPEYSPVVITTPRGVLLRAHKMWFAA